VALVTSREAAAYKDFLKVLGARMGGLTISFIHTQVQGEDAPRQIIEALAIANTELKNVDVIVLVRGGGSLEDLMAFNDEQVVRAVAGSRTPTIVGIGHERDITLAELAADLRASTPSNAAELLTPSREQLAADIARLELQLTTAVRTAIQTIHHEVAQAVGALKARIVSTSHEVKRRIDSLRALGQRFHFTVEQQHTQVATMERIVASFSPIHILKRGYSITKTSKGKIVRRQADVTAGTELVSTVQDGEITSTVVG
jgi:exodeoxyribonuclease VII large subunit